MEILLSSNNIMFSPKIMGQGNDLTGLGAETDPNAEEEAGKEHGCQGGAPNEIRSPRDQPFQR